MGQIYARKALYKVLCALCGGFLHLCLQNLVCYGQCSDGYHYACDLHNIVCGGVGLYNAAEAAKFTYEYEDCYEYYIVRIIQACFVDCLFYIHNLYCFSCEGGAVYYRATEGYLVGILELVAHRYSSCDDRQLYIILHQLAVDVEVCGVALHSGT